MSKTPQAGLYRLIKSLSQTEKRYFKVKMKSSGQKGSYQFMELFDLISSMDNYNEEELKKKLGKKGSDKHLAFRKSHLYNLILSSLRNYHKNKSPEVEVLNLLQDIKITFDRGLFLQSEKLLKKLKTKCLAYNFHQYMIAATVWEQKLIGNLKGKTFKQASKYETEKGIVNSLIKEQQELLAYLKKDINLWSLRIELLDLYRFDKAGLKKPIAQFKKEVNACIKSLPANKYHLEFIIQTHTINGLIDYFEGNYNSARKSQKQLIELLEKEHKFIKNNINNYASEINNFLAFSFVANNVDDVVKWLGVLKNLLNNVDVRSNAYLNSRVFSFYQVNSLRYYNSIGEYENAIESFNEDKFSRLQLQMNPYKQFQITYNLVLAYFYSNDLSKSLLWINILINSDVQIRPQDLSLIRSLSYVIYYQLGNGSIIESLHHSKDKSILDKLNTNLSEKVLLDGLYHLYMHPESSKKIKKDLLIKYEQAVTTKTNPQKNLMRYLQEKL